MTGNRFRLLYLKSTEQENDSPGRPLFSPRPEGLEEFRNVQMESDQESPTIREILKQAKADLKHPDPKIRILAVEYYLEKSHLSITMPLLQEVLSDPDGGVRSKALSKLIMFQNPVVLPFLKKHLKDPDPEVRMVALRGLFSIKEKIDMNLLMQLLSDNSHWVRRKLATLLGWHQMEGSLPILMEMSKDEHPMVRKAALFSLVTLYPEEGERRLMEAMTDLAPDIRKWARDHLERRLDRSTTKEKMSHTRTT